MQILSVCQTDGKKNKYNQFAYKAKVHIVDGFLHADNMEYFAKSTLKK